ncbi:MAG TPA: ATP-binding cassette domain-containing protein, partial [Pseudothermotoga sp.]
MVRLLILDNVSLIRDEKYILKNINAVFQMSKIYTILGTNGAGKSSLAYLIMGINDYKPSTGKILLDGEDITNLSITDKAKKGLTLLWQEPVRFQGLTIEQYLTLGGKLKISNDQIDFVLDFVGLSPELYKHRMVDGLLSGGERKRVELASVLLLNPRYAILDEPDSGIDIMSLSMIEKVIEYIVKNKGTVIVITHREEIAKISQEAYLLCNGSILAQGSPDKI